MLFNVLIQDSSPWLASIYQALCVVCSWDHEVSESLEWSLPFQKRFCLVGRDSSSKVSIYSVC